jgi:hypothetical protein
VKDKSRSNPLGKEGTFTAVYTQFRAENLPPSPEGEGRGGGERLLTAEWSRLSRRRFLQRSAVAAGALALPLPNALQAADDRPAPSKRVAVGLIGHGLMGGGHLQRLAYDRGFQLLAVCDVDQSRRENGREKTEAIYASTEPSGTYRGCTVHNDFREVLAREDIDAVLIATPDHWHALISVEAIKAGKDVYCEKPVSLTLNEGRILADAAKLYGCVFQTGTQYRSIPAIRRVCRFIREGGLGRIKQVFTPYSPLSGFFGAERFKPYQEVINPQQCGRLYTPTDFALPGETVPTGLDWDLWVGPAPWQPYNPLYHVNPSPGVVPWSFSAAFGVTSSTWFLSHAADVIQWALGYETSGPVEIIHPDAGKYPTLTCRYENGVLLHFVDHWNIVKTEYHAVPEKSRLAGNFGGLFVGERGWVTTMSAGGRLEGEPESLFAEMGLERTPEVNIGSNDHHANWLKCIHTRENPSADAEIGHRGASLGHLANIACWTGQSLKWDTVAERFTNNEGANRLLSRAMRPPWRMG